MLAEKTDDLFAFAGPHEAVIDINAGQLVANRFVDQHSGHGRIDAAREPADHPALADLRADLGDGLRLVGGHRPVAGEARHAVDEVAQQFCAVGRMHDFRMELRAVEAPGGIGDHGVGRTRRFRDDSEARRHFGDVVPVAHPDLFFFAFKQAIEERVGLHALDECPAKLAAGAAFDPAAQLMHHHLLAVADAEHRNSGLEDGLVGHRRIVPVDAGGPT